MKAAISFTRKTRTVIFSPRRLLVLLICVAAAVSLSWSVWIALAANRTWTGNSINNPNPALRDNFWTTAENWSGNIAPSANDDLIFSSSAQPGSVNTFANGTTFNSISISGGHTIQR
ncbi:MAG: hypothetical protein ACRD6N_06500, partial [Pyrinomonadaceae bacterium]